MRKVLIVIVALATMAVLVACEPVAFEVTPVASGLNRPWDIAFTPDGTMLFTEKTGEINALVDGAVVQLADPPDSVVSGEGGMMGIAVDGNFSSNRFIYTCFVSNISGSLDVRVARWRVNGAYSALSRRVDIVAGIPVSTGRHSGCRPRWGPDGYLWIGTGDAATGTNPQDPQSLGGKVLRVKRNGAGAPGNPGGAFLPQIYTYGHRNVQGIAFHPNGTAFSIEHGTNCDDEVNILRAGGNYGWDPVPLGGGPGYNEAVPMTDLVKFPDAIPAVWSSGCPTIAPSGGGFVVGSTWGKWSGSLAVAVLKGTRVMFLKFGGPDGHLVERHDRITDRGRLRTAVLGPEGDLYVSQDASPGSILRIHPILGDPS